MRFNELVRLLEKNGFTLLREKGSIRYYSKSGHDKLIRVDYHGSKEVPSWHLSRDSKGCWYRRYSEMIDLKYSLIIEATDDPNFFGFYSTELEGFTGVGHSIEDCLYKARWGMEEHLTLLADQHLPIPEVNQNPIVTVQNSQRIAPAA
jgi:predicted RNA binding protein YcfA (HicA-like mRNA interferase family)/predicted RNase H-like HicB family nuclease